MILPLCEFISHCTVRLFGTPKDEKVHNKCKKLTFKVKPIFNVKNHLNLSENDFSLGIKGPFFVVDIDFLKQLAFQEWK